MNDLDTLALAIVIAAGNDDWDAVDELTAKAPDPAALQKAIDEVTATPPARAGPKGVLFSDDPSPAVKPPTVPLIRTRAKPDASETALAGKDGRAVAKMIADSKSYGVKVMADVVAGAVQRYKGAGPLLDRFELAKLAGSLAAVNATAELLGRSRVREMAERAVAFEGLHNDPTGDVPFKKFAEAPSGIIATPEAAVEYFTSLAPKLGIDPERFGESMRRGAFTLAASTNEVLTRKVQAVIAEAMRNSRGVADTQAKIGAALTAAGVAPANPQYSEMVFRTNAMDSFQQGFYDEGSHPDHEDLFPVWQYLIVDDDRTGEDHRPKGGRYYPRSATFSDVRGNRPFNCRCNLAWCDRYDWADLSRRGAEVEANW